MKRSVLLFLILIFSMGSVFSQQWQKVGPYNGNGPALLDLIQETSNPQILYAASNGGGIFKSFDKGDSWEKISQNFITGDMGSLAASAGNPDVIYVCGSGGRILKSIDGGSEWANISGNLPASYITDVEIRQGSGEIYVAMSGPAYGEGGLFVTEDEMNWVEISQDFTIKKVVCFEINPTNPHCFYAGTQQYAINGILYRSLDSGVNWTEILDVSIMDLKVDPNNDQKLIAAADYDRIYYSEDNGDTWDYYHGFPASTDFLDIAINANNSEEMLVASQGSNYAIPGIYRSTNGGLSWFGSGNGMASRLVFSVLIDYENGQNAFCGSTVGFHKSVDGGANWVTSIAGMKRLFVYSILVKPNNPDHWIAKTDLGVAITENQGRDWVSNFGYCMPIVYLPGSDTVYGILGSGSFSDGVYRSIDDGFNWVVVKYMMYATDLDIVNENPSTMYVITSGSVYRSDNGGYNWTSASGGINENPVKCLEIDQNHPDTMFAITTSKVWKTVDGGIAWDELLGPFEEYEPVTLNVDPINSAQIYIGTNEAMIKSENGGDDWIVEDLPCTGLRAVSVSSVYDGFIAAGFDTEGVYISQDEGSTWAEMNEGLNNKAVNCMAISPGSEFLLCGTHGDAIYKSDISFVGLELEGNDILSTLNIFPVPAKDEIYIETDYEFESIEVYNISGERQKISYDRAVLLSGLPPGIYFVAVHFANGYKSVTRKIVKM